MELMNLSCEAFLEDLAGSAPAPGGGGAAALVGAAGAALGNMVGSLTVGKKKYAAVEADILILNRRAAALRKRLEGLVQADTAGRSLQAAQRDPGAAGPQSRCAGGRAGRGLCCAAGDYVRLL